MPAVIEPALVVEAERLDDERVAVPLAERVAEPCRLTFSWIVATVGEDLTVLREVLEQDDRESWCLNELPRIVRHQHGVGDRVRQASARGAIASFILLTLF